MRISFCVIVATLMVACGASSATKKGAETASEGTSSTASAVAGPKRLSYSIEATYPHPTDHYTQGLLWNDGLLYESTGEYGHSGVFISTLDGKVKRTTSLGRQYFGEGIALMGGRLYMLTWLEQQGFIFDGESLAPRGEFNYYGEGWGLTSDGQVLYMSDGTHIIRILDAATLAVKGRIDVRWGKRAVRMLNELEWIDGHIWANVYGTNRIVIINPADGQVESYLDLDELELTQSANPVRDVLNGIAYDAASGRVWVTGKNWDKIFEIKITQDNE